MPKENKRTWQIRTKWDDAEANVIRSIVKYYGCSYSAAIRMLAHRNNMPDDFCKMFNLPSESIKPPLTNSSFGD